MRGLVIVHESDMTQMEGLAASNGRLSSEIFDIEDSSFEWCKFFIDRSNHPVLEHEDGSRIEADNIGVRWSVIILIAGRQAAVDGRLRTVLRTFLHGAGSPAWSNETLIVITVAPVEGSPLHDLMPGRVFFTPDSSSAPAPEFPSEDWKSRVKSEFDGHVRTIDENQTRNPNVGFGLLLLDRRCNCLLMERLRDPGRGRLGTIGGNFERGHDILSELTTVLTRRFRRDGAPEVDLGPLLSCTNMKNEFLHYIDLTFLAIVKGGNVRDVSDEELRPPGQDALGRLNDEGVRQARVMFTLPEVAIFHREGLLFTPVANAFEALCRRIFNEQLRHGRRKKVQVPSLTDESRMLELQLPEDPDCIRRIVTEMRWSNTALPFFEGDIS